MQNFNAEFRLKIFNFNDLSDSFSQNWLAGLEFEARKKSFSVDKGEHELQCTKERIGSDVYEDC